VKQAKKAQLTVPESPAFQTRKAKTAVRPSVSHYRSFWHFKSARQILN